MSERRTLSAGPSNTRRRIELILLLCVLLAAAFLRLWRLDSVPPGLTHDEANNVHDAAAVLDGVRPAYFPVAQGKEPLYPYSVAALMSLLGRSPWTMRLTSAVWGLLLVVLSYAWMRRAFGPAIALLAAAGLAVGFWPVTTSRMGLRAITLPALFTAAVYFLWRGIGLPRARPGAPLGILPSPFYVLAGLALGASWYTYLAARPLPLVLGLFWVYLSLGQRRIVWGVLLSLAVAAVVATPLLLYLNAHPAAEIRVGQLDQPLHALLDGDPGPLLDRVGTTLRVFSLGGDTFVPYNLPGKPLLDPLMGVLFYAGLALALWRWRQPAYALALLWLGVGSSPALVTGVEAANLRAIAAQPVLYLFPALSLHAIGRWLRWPPRRREGTWPRLKVCGAVLLFAAVAVLTYRDYFTRWANDRDVRVHYHAGLVAVADYVRAHPGETFVISALYPGQYHDPRVVEAELGGDGARLRWADGRGALVLPADQPVAFIVPAAVPLDPVLESMLEPQWERVAHVTVRPDDFNPTFDVQRWAGRPAPSQQPLAQVGDSLRLLAADLRALQVTAGATLELVTTWQIADPLPADRDAVLFAQLLGPAGKVVVQQDRLDAPSWNWHPGDQFVQLFRISLPPDLDPGAYRLISGAYTRPDRVDAVLAGREPDPAMPRLPVLVDGQAGGDFVELPTIEVVADE